MSTNILNRIDAFLGITKTADAATMHNFEASIQEAKRSPQIMTALHDLSDFVQSITAELATEQKLDSKNSDLNKCRDFMASIPGLISITQNGVVTDLVSLRIAALALVEVVNHACRATKIAIGEKK